MVMSKWWGWGQEGVHYSLERRPGFWPFLEQAFGRSLEGRKPPVPLESIELPDSKITVEQRAALENIFSNDALRWDKLERVRHAAGKSYRDLIRVREGKIEASPDVVVYPSKESQIVDLLRAAADLGLAVVPFGGGTSVVGGVEPARGGKGAVVTCDLARMNRLLHIDHESRTADVEAGILGPDLEDKLTAHGLTLGHFPQSFEFSTLGGWVATRSAGQQSIRYGKIEDMVVSLKMATASGILETRAVPASATGPSLKQMLVGSEGLFGVLTRICVRVRPVPEARDYRAFVFPSFIDGQAAVRQLLQKEAFPALVRLSDEEETRTFAALSKAPASTLDELKKRVGLWYLERRGLGLQRSCLMLVGYEGEPRTVQRCAANGAEILRKAGGLDIGHGPVSSWYEERFTMPYLRDRLLDHQILVETLETCVSYSRLLALYGAVSLAIRRAIEADGVRGLVLCHLSHAYTDGASLYFTFMVPQVEGDEMGQWKRIKVAATETILRHGGTLSHHHGVGADHRKWIAEEHGKQGLEALRGLKRFFDPHSILNPGKLL